MLHMLKQMLVRALIQWLLPKGAIELTKIINDWGRFHDNNQEVTKFWMLLSVMRGPDNCNEKLKYHTTAVIRKLIFPDIASRAGASINEINKYISINKMAELYPNRIDQHFYNHIKLVEVSIQELELIDWNKYNEQHDKDEIQNTI